MHACRLALLAGIRANPGGAQEMKLRADWLLHAGWELPRSLPHLLDVRFGADEDDAVLSVPSCCVWSSGGLLNNTASAAAPCKGGSVHPALRQLASACPKEPPHR